MSIEAHVREKNAITSARGMRGGPEAISAAFVPGRIRLVEPSSCLATSPS